MRKGGDSQQRPYKLIHQIVSLTGINFNTKSIIGIVELTILPSRDGVKDIRLNAKQLLIYKVSLKAFNGQTFEPTFQYGDPMLEVVKEDANVRDLETFSKAHFEECTGVEPELNRGELCIVIPREAQVKANERLKVSIEFSMENPEGGIHFVVPKNDPEQTEEVCFYVKMMILIYVKFIIIFIFYMKFTETNSFDIIFHKYNQKECWNKRKDHGRTSSSHVHIESRKFCKIMVPMCGFLQRTLYLEIGIHC